MLDLRHGVKALGRCRLLVSKNIVRGGSDLFRNFQKEHQDSLSGARLYSSEGTPEQQSPLDAILQAMDTLDKFSSVLRNTADTINEKIVLPSGQAATLKDICLHSRDADLKAFQSPASVSARGAVLPKAESIEQQMKQLAESYRKTVEPQMELATKICRDTPCGGASWEVDLASIEKQKRIEGDETPCGRLHLKSMDFVQLTFETRFDMAIGCRAGVLLRLAHQRFDAPLSVIRERGGDDRTEMNKAFAAQMIDTPWIKSEQEYKDYFRIRDELKQQGT